MTAPATTPDLTALAAGFSNESLGSQAVFRAVLQALSHPGRWVEVPHDAQHPTVGSAAGAAALLALLDSDCAVWLSPALLAGGAGQWLRFHTGCALVADAAAARFVWLAYGDQMPPLATLAQGSDIYPDQSATCVIDVQGIRSPADATATGWTLRGPGIQGATTLQVQGLPSDFEHQWAANQAVFPCGVDVLLCAGHQVVGLPRTTHLSARPLQPSAAEHEACM